MFVWYRSPRSPIRVTWLILHYIVTICAPGIRLTWKPQCRPFVVGLWLYCGLCQAHFLQIVMVASGYLLCHSQINLTKPTDIWIDLTKVLDFAHWRNVENAVVAEDCHLVFAQISKLRNIAWDANNHPTATGSPRPSFHGPQLFWRWDMYKVIFISR